MKLYKNDNRKEMTNKEAKLFAIAGIGGMLLIASPTFIAPTVALGMFGAFSLIVARK